MVRYVVRRDGKSYSASSNDELVAWARSGRVARSDLIHVDDGSGWRKASDLDFLMGSLSEPDKPKPSQPPIVYWTQKGHQNRLIGDLQVVVAWIRDGSLRADDILFHAGTQAWFELRDSAFLLSILESDGGAKAILPSAVDPVVESITDMPDDFLAQEESTNVQEAERDSGFTTGPLTTEETRRIVEGVLNTEEFESPEQLTSSTTMTALSPFCSERAKIWAERLESLPSDGEAKLHDRHNLFPIIYDVARCFLDLKNGNAIEGTYTLELGAIGKSIQVGSPTEAYAELNTALDEHLSDRVQNVLGVLVENERAGFRRYVEGLLEVMFWINEMLKPVELESSDTAEMNTVTVEAEPIARLETAIRHLILVRQRRK